MYFYNTISILWEGLLELCRMESPTTSLNQRHKKGKIIAERSLAKSEKEKESLQLEHIVSHVHIHSVTILVMGRNATIVTMRTLPKTNIRLGSQEPVTSRKPKTF